MGIRTVSRAAAADTLSAGLSEPYQIAEVRSFGEKRRLQTLIYETDASLVRRHLRRRPVLLGFMGL